MASAISGRFHREEMTMTDNTQATQPPTTCPACQSKPMPKSNDIDTWYECAQLYQLVDGIWKPNTEWSCNRAFSAAVALRATVAQLTARAEQAEAERDAAANRLASVFDEIRVLRGVAEDDSDWSGLFSNASQTAKDCEAAIRKLKTWLKETESDRNALTARVGELETQLSQAHSELYGEPYCKCGHDKRMHSSRAFKCLMENCGCEKFDAAPSQPALTEVQDNDVLIDDGRLPRTPNSSRPVKLKLKSKWGSKDAAPTDAGRAVCDAAFDFHVHLIRQREFSEKTFGPGKRTSGIVDHIRKELKEIEQDPDDATEWIDVVILALDGAWRIGLTPDQIIRCLVNKQDKNEARIWPDWKTADPDKAIQHVRVVAALAPASATGDAGQE